MRRVPHEGQMPRSLQLMATSVRAPAVATQTQKPKREYAAFEIHIEFVFDELG